MKQDAKSKDKVSEQDSNFDAIFEKQFYNLLLQIQEDNKIISSTLYAQDKKMSSLTTSYNERLHKMSSSNKVRTKIKTEKHNLKQQWIWNLMHSKLKSKLVTQQHSTSLTWNYQISLKKNLLFLWTTLWWYYPMDTPQVTWKIFTCITIFQTPVSQDP